MPHNATNWREFSSDSKHLLSTTIWLSMHIIAFDQLEKGYKNPKDQCTELNSVLFIEFVLLVFLNILFGVSREIFSITLNLPVILYYITRYRKRSSDQPAIYKLYLYNPTTVMNEEEFSQG
ncbi:hypothetical protein Pmani_012351 [Petrolisthes manimaculis]|uniref:Uncharacterized protein n=1 Tax=Petrolisthes manimaculis TaxID=1843537 RepID=A0AAE1PY12_9EUCA|nr:hypothetical protein Pmani_012351 [Petrolisthes manimaculis]